jgi:hypothetical protein
MARSLGLDPRIGHLALIGDFVPVTLKFEEDLRFRYIGPVKEKVRAKFEQGVTLE